MNSLDILRGITNPKQYVINQLTSSNPMISNLIDMAQKGQTQNIENFARNFCRERNVDFDTKFAEFMNRR